MEKESFNINFNGKSVAVNCVDEYTYAVQISYKLLYLHLETDENGAVTFIDVENNKETMLAKEIGSLILKHSSLASHTT